MATVSRYDSSTVVVENNGRKEYLRAPNGAVYKFLFIRNYINLGYEIDPDLMALYQKDKDAQAESELTVAQRQDRCIQQAIATGKPVVVSSCGYSTTASVGTNYAVAMPNGQVWGVQSGNSRASHGDKTAYHISVCGVSESDRDAVIETIKTHHD